MFRRHISNIKFFMKHARAFGIEVFKYRIELESNWNSYLEKISLSTIRDPVFLSGITEVDTLYIVTRALNPEVVVETGVGYGLSSNSF